MKKQLRMGRRFIVVTVSLFILPPYCWALQLSLPEKAFQGDLILGKVEPPASVLVNGEQHLVSSEGYFVVGVPRLERKDLSVFATNGKEEVSKTIRTLAYKWGVQRIDGLSSRYVTPPPEAMKQIEKDNQRVLDIRQAEAHSAPLFLENGFVSPVNGPISSIFGDQRILNGQQRSSHRGVDFSAPKGTPVYSPTNGIVRLVAKEMYLMGNTLMLDHGLGVQSIFIHLASILVREGDPIEQGKIVGLVGETGRASAPHLHWGISVGSILVDPVKLLNKSYMIP
jgi:murein DD-endopeptidase MepM/ murein hydrolase activator NlpD